MLENGPLWGFTQEEYKQEIGKGLEFAKNRNALDFIWNQLGEKSALIALIQQSSALAVHFAEVTTRSQLKVKSIIQHPWEILLDAPSVTTDETARYIFSFLRDFYPDVSTFPIRFYKTTRDFINRNPFAVYKINDLVSKVA